MGTLHALQARTALDLLNRAQGLSSHAQRKPGALSSADQSARDPSDTTALTPQAKTIQLIKKMAASPDFASAARGIADKKIIQMVRDGAIAPLAQLSDSDYAHLSTAEKNIYGVISGLQSYFDAQPRSQQDALSQHISVVLESYPDDIARMKAGLANGTLKEEEGWNDIIAREEAELKAARTGKMQIHDVTGKGLVWSKGEVTVSHNGFGWSTNGPATEANFSALQRQFGSANILPGYSPYCGTYVMSW